MSLWRRRRRPARIWRPALFNLCSRWPSKEGNATIRPLLCHLPRHLTFSLLWEKHDGSVPKANREGSMPIGLPGHMRVHAPTCASYMYIDACQNQIRGPLPAIIRFRLLRNNGNLYDWPAEFALRGTHSTVTVSFVCLPGLLSTGDYSLSIPLPSPAALILVSALVLFPSAALQVPNTLCTFCSFLHDHVATIVAAEVQGHERPSPEHRQGGP
jgi:hypothetical protein